MMFVLLTACRGLEGRKEVTEQCHHTTNKVACPFHTSPYILMESSRKNNRLAIRHLPEYVKAVAIRKLYIQQHHIGVRVCH